MVSVSVLASVCVGKTEEESECCGLYLCWWLFVCSVKVSNHSELTVKQLWNAQVLVEDERKEGKTRRTTRSKAAVWIFVRFILEHLACVWYLLLCLEEALDHYQVLVSGWSWGISNLGVMFSEPLLNQHKVIPVTALRGCLIEKRWWYIWRRHEIFRN